MQHDRTYTSADFHRYHAGTMPSDEMHALEKAALEDPFLADALEGYVNTSTFDNDIDEIKERLNEKKNKKKVIPVTSFMYSRWWRVAALLIVIAGAGFIFYMLNNKSRERPLAINNTTLIPQKKDSAAVPNNVQTKNADTLKNNTAFENKQPVQSGKVIESFKELAPPSQALPPTKDAFDKKENSKQQSLKTQSDSIHFSIGELANKKDSNTEVIGYGIKKTPVKNGAITTTPMVQSETVNQEKDIDYKQGAVARKDAIGSVSSSRALKEVKPSLDNTDAFNKYLKDSTQPVYDTANNQITGEVILSFTVNKKGHPQNILVVRSTCAACETQAIHLLQNGPVWKRDKGEGKKQVSVKF